MIQYYLKVAFLIISKEILDRYLRIRFGPFFKKRNKKMIKTGTYRVDDYLYSYFFDKNGNLTKMS